MRTYYIILFCLPFLFSCEMKKDLLGGGKDSEDERPSYENIGLLNLKLKPEKEAAVPGTKVDDASSENELNPKDFAVAILDSVGQTVKEYESYGDMEDDGKLLLPAGKYSIKATYGSDPNAGFDAPYYAGDTTCVVSEKEVVEIVAECRLGNKKIQFLCTDDFLSQFNDDYYIVIDNGAGVLTLTKDEMRIAYLKNTGILRFTMYATTHDNVVHTYSHDLSKDELINSHNNVLIALGAASETPGGGDNNTPDDPEEPEAPDDEEPGGSETPVIPVKSPVIKVDVSLIEKDYVIEVPSDFVESDKPDTPDGDDNNGGGDDDNQGGSDNKPSDTPTITGTIDGKSFNVSQSQDVSSAKSVVINMNLPTGLSALTARVLIGEDIDLDLDLLDYEESDFASVLSQMGLPKKGDKGKLKFDISPFLELMQATNSFKVMVKDNNGKSITATINLTKK